LLGCGIDSAEIEVEGGEVPILDGSSLPFVNRLLEAGEEEIDLPKSVLRILKPIHVCIQLHSQTNSELIV
jgi:UDP-3-O-[3-hydroxymyristoyl] N-acetylglucosamine deacetylase